MHSPYGLSKGSLVSPVNWEKGEKVTGRRVSSGFRVGIKLPPSYHQARHFVPWGSVFWSAKWGHYQLLKIQLSSMWMESESGVMLCPSTFMPLPRLNSDVCSSRPHFPHFWRPTSPEKHKGALLCGRLGADHPCLPPQMARHFFPDWRAGQRPAWMETGRIRAMFLLGSFRL